MTPSTSPRSVSTRREDAAVATPGEEHVRHPSRIRGLLEQLVHRRSLLSVDLADDDASYSSALLAVDRDADMLSLDELTPSDGHRRVAVGTRLRVTARRDGVLLGFDAPVVEVARDADAAFYRSPIPAELLYQQRRSHYRARVSGGVKVPVQLSLGGDKRVDAELHDISLGGIAVRVASQAEALLPPFGEPMGCLMELPGGQRVSCRVQIRYAAPRNGRRACVVGGGFLDLEAADRARIQRFIAYLDRQLARRRPR